jgi:hypothetical protein
MQGEGTTVAAGRIYAFDFQVIELPTGVDRGGLRLDITRPDGGRGNNGHKNNDDGNRGQEKDDRNGSRDRFVTTRLDSIVFTAGAASGPGRRPALDRAAFTGVGRWNGTPGYTFTAQAVDAGEPRAGRDLFAITIRDPRGVIVATVSGPISTGDIESSRLRIR